LYACSVASGARDTAQSVTFAEHTSGWAQIAERLRDYAPKQRSIVAD
jgi:hypothetical protein